MFGGLFSLVTSVAGMGFQLAGMNMQMQAQEQEAALSATITTFQAQQQAAQYSLYATMQHRQAIQAVRQAQVANAKNFSTIVGQGGNMFGSAAGGARGQTSGEESTAISGITENMDTASQMMKLNEQIDMAKIQMAMAQTQAAQGAGEMALGGDIAKIGSSFGNVFGGGGNVLAGLQGLFGGTSVATGNDIFSSQGVGSGLSGGL
jgi:hypothetical protein